MTYVSSSPNPDLLIVDPTSKAARIAPVDLKGISRAPKYAFRMQSNPFVATAGTGAFFALGGSNSRIVTVQRLLATCPTLTAAQYLGVLARKWSGGISGGTIGSFAVTALDNSGPLSSAVLVATYTAPPTTGLSIGAIGNQLRLVQSSTAAAGTLPDAWAWDFRDDGEAGGVVLRGRDEVLTLAFTTAPATAVTLSIEAEWLEE
jgi:hypothetical protein